MYRTTLFQFEYQLKVIHRKLFVINCFVYSNVFNCFPINAATFDVSNATIAMYKGSYCVICEFVEGSRCQGCKIDIIEANTATQLATFAVPRFNDASSVAQCLNTLSLPSGEYYVHVSDIENDGSYSDTARTLVFSIYNSEQSGKLQFTIVTDNY